MNLKRILGLICYMGLVMVGAKLSTEVWLPTILVFHPIAGIIALLLYDGKNFLKGGWDLAKTGILAVAMIGGYILLLLYIFGAQKDSVPNRS